MTEAGGQAGPIDAAERSTLLDALRGWALLGILIANMVAFIGFPFLSGAERQATIGSWLDDLAELLLEWLVVGKFYSIFSLLFGIGFAIQLGRLEARGEGVARYLRRLAVLFMIGLAHLFLLWIGDIVALYALMGAVLLLFRRTSDRGLILWAISLWLVPIAWSALIHLGGINPAEPIYGAGVRTLVAFGIDPNINPLTYYRNTGFIDALAVHPAEAWFRLGDLVYQMRFTKVLGMFLIGLWVGRRAIYARLDDHAPLLRQVSRWGLGIGLPVSLLRAMLSMWPGDEQPLIEFAAESAYAIGTPLLALGYVATFALLWRSGTRAWQRWPAPAGRMALTNYLAQTILQGTIFYGWGFGLTGRFGLAWIYPFAAALYALQIAWSRWWLARYRFGPVEWLWRSLTYGHAQTMRLIAA